MPMKNAGVVLLLLFGVVSGELSVKKHQQPDVDSIESLSAEGTESAEEAGAVWASNSNSEDAIEDHPPIEDFLTLRQHNAELALQVEEVTSELRQLKHDKKMTIMRTKFAVSKLQRKCAASDPEAKHEDAFTPDVLEGPMEDLHVKVMTGQASMPWSLTHTATRHRTRTRWPGFSGEGIFKGMTDYFKEGSTAVKAVGSYLRKIPVLKNSEEEDEEKAAAELKQINAKLKETRVRLGRNKEARRGLEEHYGALMLRMAQAKGEAETDQKSLEEAVKREKELDQEIADAKARLQQHQAVNPQDAVKVVADSQSKAEIAQAQEVQNVSMSLHAEVAKRMNDTAKVIDSLKAENDQLKVQIEQVKAEVPDKQMRLDNLMKAVNNATSKIGSLNTKKDNLLHEETDEEQRVAKEDEQLMMTSGQLENCDDWGHKLEKKLKQVLISKQEDGKLCHKSILGLHNERVKLKQELHAQHKVLKEQKDTSASIQQKGDESLNMLNQCLGRLK